MTVDKMLLVVARQLELLGEGMKGMEGSLSLVILDGWGCGLEAMWFCRDGDGGGVGDGDGDGDGGGDGVVGVG